MTTYWICAAQSPRSFPIIAQLATYVLTVNEDLLADRLAVACEQYAVPGAQVGLLRGADRSVLCHGTRELLERAPVVPETPFHAGSLAKSLTALVVAEAARRGEIDLDRPCAEQAPGLWDDTPRALMAQTTGRPNVLPELSEDTAGFVRRVGALPRVHPPGRFSYCNAGWPVLDLLLQECSEAGFEELATRWVLGSGATFGEPDNAARGHGASPGQPAHSVPGEYAAAATAAGTRWWATADQLLDYARLHLNDGAGRFPSEVVRELRRPHATVPGATIADAWGLGWALWDRGEHRAFGWAGYTGGHRAYLRCFPDQDAALVVLTNCAGPIFGPPGGSALFDALLPTLLDQLGVPPFGAFAGNAGRDLAMLAGDFGPLRLSRGSADSLVLDATAFGEPEPLEFARLSGDTFARVGDPPGGMTIAVDGDLLYVGPFAFPRTS